MENFKYYAPTEVRFGKAVENDCGEAVKAWGGSRVFLIYGGGSVVKSGLLSRVEASLEAAGIAYESRGGVKPNPTLAFAEELAGYAKDFAADMILAVGGGSVIDTSKAVAHAVANPDAKIWDIWCGKYPLTKSTPVGVVLTIAAAGSEMSDSAVLTNEEKQQKRGLSTVHNRCKFALMNPELLFTLPDYQIACGVCDIMMHTLERYFIPNCSCRMTDEIAEGLLRTVIDNGRIVMKERDNFNAMAEVMWASSLSHNDITGLGRPKDFSVHKFAQALGGMYDKAHGATLSAVWGAWADYLYKDEPARFAKYARNVWGVQDADDLAAAKEGIDKTVAFFKELGLPTTITELGVSPDDAAFDALANETTRDGTLTLTCIKPLGFAEVREVLVNAK